MANLEAAVGSFYAHVIEDVISQVHADFQSEGVDDSVLQELQELWELKMVQVGAPVRMHPHMLSTGGPPHMLSTGGPGIVPPVQDLNIPYQGTEEDDRIFSAAGFQPRPNLGGTSQHVMYQYMPPAPGIDPNVGRPLPYMQQPAPWMNRKLQGVDINIAYQGEENDGGEAPYYQDLSGHLSGKRKRESLNAEHFAGTYIPQQDGASDFEFYQNLNLYASNLQIMQTPAEVPFAAAPVTDSTIYPRLQQHDQVGEDYEDVAEEDYNEPEQKGLGNQSNTPALAKPEPVEEQPESTNDEPPLNEDDDENDDAVINEEERNLVLCQFEKVTRSKNKWKCMLKDGIMRLNNRDIVISKATGEFEF